MPRLSPDFTSDAPPRRRWPWAAAAILALVSMVGAAWAVGWWIDWGKKRALDPSGGMYFVRPLVLDVPAYRQADSKWRADLLGPTESTLGAEGCAVASAAMVMRFYGMEVDPGRLNAFLTEHGGYTERGWIYWEKAVELQPGLARHVYEDEPSYRLIDSNLAAGNPVIARLRYPSGITHFVVIVGKRGFDYLIRDPGAGAEKGVYPLREFGSQIEALRFYERLADA